MEGHKKHATLIFLLNINFSHANSCGLAPQLEVTKNGNEDKRVKIFSRWNILQIKFGPFFKNKLQRSLRKRQTMPFNPVLDCHRIKYSCLPNQSSAIWVDGRKPQMEAQSSSFSQFGRRTKNGLWPKPGKTYNPCAIIGDTIYKISLKFSWDNWNMLKLTSNTCAGLRCAIELKLNKNITCYQSSTFRLMFSHFELTWDHILLAYVMIFFTVDVKAVK